MRAKLFIILVSLFLTGCSPKAITLCIQGTPGSTIMDLSERVIGRIGDNGQTNIVISDYQYHGMFLSQEPGSNIKIPFALDYHNTSGDEYKKLKTIELGLAVVTCVSMGGALILGISSMTGGAEAGAALAGAGVGAIGGALSGLALSTGSLSASTTTQCYEYEDVQHTNGDLSK